MKFLSLIGICFSISTFALPAYASVQWCAVQTNNGKIVKCHSNLKSCERYVKGRFNWTCVPVQK